MDVEAGPCNDECAGERKSGKAVKREDRKEKFLGTQKNPASQVPSNYNPKKLAYLRTGEGALVIAGGGIVSRLVPLEHNGDGGAAVGPTQGSR